MFLVYFIFIKLTNNLTTIFRNHQSTELTYLNIFPFATKKMDQSII